MALTTKDILKEKRKADKSFKRAQKKPRNVLKSILAVITGLLLGVGVMALINQIQPAKIDGFVLDGDATTIVYQGDSYVELGIEPTIRNSTAIISDPIYYDSSLNVIPAIDTGVIGTYYVAYTLSNSYYSRTIYRKVEVTERPPIADIEFHFLELGNNKAGSCIYIKAGENDILIDAGSTQTSATTISNYIAPYIGEDKTIEYAIATCNTADHTAGFTSTDTTKGIFELYDVKTIIDFSNTNKLVTNTDYKAYMDARNQEVLNGATHYRAIDCISTGGTSTFVLGQDLSMTVLNNTYYSLSAENEGDYSVCLLFKAGEKKFLFTSDLYENGESKLITKNSGVIRDVDFFMAAQHGSSTANSVAFLEYIKPKNVVVECVAGSTQFTNIASDTYPTQAFIDRIAEYTTSVYVTSQAVGTSSYKSLNGNIILSCIEGGDLAFNCSYNNALLKDTVWFASNRMWP